jgi:hypothetical protein
MIQIDGIDHNNLELEANKINKMSRSPNVVRVALEFIHDIAAPWHINMDVYNTCRGSHWTLNQVKSLSKQMVQHFRKIKANGTTFEEPNQQLM